MLAHQLARWAGELLRSSRDRAWLPPSFNSAPFCVDCSLFGVGVLDGSVFEDLKPCRRLIDDMKAVTIFVGHWRGPQFVNQQGD